MITLRPSSASRWMRCAGSVYMQALHPEQPGDNTVRDEGTAGHWAACEIANGRRVPVGTIAPNGVEITDDIADGVQTYLGELFGWGAPVYVEAPVECKRVHPACNGTVDAWSWDATNRILRVADLKLGYRPVDAFENWQLLTYLRGVLDYLNLDAHFTFELIIIQPRAYGNPVKKVWRGNSETLRTYFERLAAGAAHAFAVAELGDASAQLTNHAAPSYTAGPHCDGCSARGNCAALQAAALAVVDLSADAALTEQHSITHAAHRLRRLHRASATLQAEIDGLEARVEHEIRNGVTVPLFELSSGNGSKVWRDGTEQQVIALGSLLGVQLAKPEKPLTVVQATAALKNVAPGVIEQYAETKPGKFKLRLLPENHARKTFEA